MENNHNHNHNRDFLSVLGLAELRDLILNHITNFDLIQLRATNRFLRSCVDNHISECTARGAIRGLAKIASQQSITRQADVIELDGQLFTVRFRCGRWCVGELNYDDFVLDTQTLEKTYLFREQDDPVRTRKSWIPFERETQSTSFAVWNNRLYMFGGNACWFGMNDLWILDLSTMKWKEIKPENATEGNDGLRWEVNDPDSWPTRTSSPSFVYENRWYFLDMLSRERRVWVFDFISEKWVCDFSFDLRPDPTHRYFWVSQVVAPGQVIAAFGDVSVIEGLSLVDVNRRSITPISGLQPFPFERITSYSPQVNVRFDQSLRRNVFDISMSEYGVAVTVVTSS